MAISIICIICAALFFFLLGVFEAFVISKLRKINSQTDNIPKHHWDMGIYMNDIPQTEKNTSYLGSVPLKIYKGCECLDTPIPRKGEKISGIYYSGENEFEMTGIIEDVFYNTNINWIIVECKCIDIQKLE